MWLRLGIVTVLLVAVFGGIGWYKYAQYQRFQDMMAAPRPAVVVSSAPVTLERWPEEIEALGTFTADQGVHVATEVPGRVQAIRFESGQRTDAGALAESLLAQGITGMKIWPFDRYAERSGGQSILPDELEEGLMPFRQIRDAVGGRMDIMLEMHSLWNQPAALQIAEAVAPFGIYWIEDAVRMQGVSALADFRARCPIRVTASETIAGRHQFRELLEAGATDYVMLDLGWCGGLSEGKAIAALADAWHRPIAPHDCTGPVVYAASCHLSLHASNAVIQESVRALYTGWYADVADGLPVVENGMVRPADGPGHGLTLKDGVFTRPDATVLESR